MCQASLCVVHECLQVTNKQGHVACSGVVHGCLPIAEMLINFRFGKFLHYPYVLFLGEVMPNFSGDHACMCVCVSA